MWDIYKSYTILEPRKKAPEQRALVFKETGKFFVQMIVDGHLIYPNEYDFIAPLFKWFFVCFNIVHNPQLQQELTNAVVNEINLKLKELDQIPVKKKVIAARDMFQRTGFSPN